MKREVKTGCMLPQLSHARIPEAEEGKAGSFLWLQRDGGPANTSTQTPSVQNSERIDSCCYKPLSVWHFVMAALKN